MTKIFDYVMDIGEQMLLSGAEVHRAEESINRMCYALGATRVDIFIITSSMVLTVHTKDGESFTQTRRVVSADTDYEKLHHLNCLSREICNTPLSASQIKQRLDKINGCKKMSVVAGVCLLRCDCGRIRYILWRQFNRGCHRLLRRCDYAIWGIPF